MSLFRRNPKRDGNEQSIVAALEAAGCMVTRISGAGVPDLLVSRGGRMWLAEVKAAKGKLEPAQVRFHAAWSGPKIHIVRTVEDALRLVGIQGEGAA